MEYAKENGIKLISKLHPQISNGNSNRIDGFVFNKDADTFQCPCGYLSIQKAKDSRKCKGNRNPVVVYYFDTEKCKNCPLKDGCYKSYFTAFTVNIKRIVKLMEPQTV